MRDAKSKIKKFISQFLGNHQPNDDDDIFSLGFVNSMFAMQLVMFIETELQVTIDNEDLDFENFRTINAMARLVERKSAGVVT